MARLSSSRLLIRGGKTLRGLINRLRKRSRLRWCALFPYAPFSRGFSAVLLGDRCLPARLRTHGSRQFVRAAVSPPAIRSGAGRELANRGAVRPERRRG